jgi:hypothetical protein
MDRWAGRGKAGIREQGTGNREKGTGIREQGAGKVRSEKVTE